MAHSFVPKPSTRRINGCYNLPEAIPLSDLPAPGYMPTIQTALSAATQSLNDSSPTPRLDAEVLMADVLGKTRAYLRAWREAALTGEQQQRFAELVAARCTGTPVAYLTGTREFWSREFVVSPDVLIPRPETELLIEWALQRADEWAGRTLLDLATGSGAIAVTLAAELAGTAVIASDISEAALRLARRNAEKHGVGRIRFLQSAWFEHFPADLRFDLIVSNPPYIAEGDPHLDEGDVRFEPVIALRAGLDGYDAYRVIADQARVWLVPGGSLLLEHGCQQAAALGELLQECGYIDIAHREDLQGHPRATCAIWPGG